MPEFPLTHHESVEAILRQKGYREYLRGPNTVMVHTKDQSIIDQALELAGQMAELSDANLLLSHYQAARATRHDLESREETWVRTARNLYAQHFGLDPEDFRSSDNPLHHEINLEINAAHTAMAIMQLRHKKLEHRDFVRNLEEVEVDNLAVKIKSRCAAEEIGRAWVKTAFQVFKDSKKPE